MKKRVISVIICLLLLIVPLSSCKENKFVPAKKPFDKKAQTYKLFDGATVAQNEEYSLKFDEDTTSISIVETSSGKIWDMCPTPTSSGASDNPFGLEGFVNESYFVKSAIRIRYISTRTTGGAETFANSYNEAERVVCKEIDNGLTVEYYFDALEIMVPVDYVLVDDYISISVDSTKIQENDDYHLVSVGLAPFLCSVENSKNTTEDEEKTDETAEDALVDLETAEDEEEFRAENAEKADNTNDSYLFIPSGSGAIINTTAQGNVGLAFDSHVYGDDVAKNEFIVPTQETAVRLPVYGYKAGDQGGFVIIDRGAETAVLHTASGAESDGFSNIYSAFQLRGSTEHESKSFKWSQILSIYPENMLEGVFSVRFYPLTGDKANYSSMADIYRNYLIDECGLEKTGEEKAVHLNLIGGTEITKSFVGVPYKTVFATTTVNDANKIVSELSEQIGNFSVKLKGFGKNGVDIGTIGGGFTISNKIGSAADLKALSGVCKDKGVDLYFDYDVVRFSTGGSGFSFSKDAVMNCGFIKADQYLMDKALCNVNDKFRYRLLRPVEFEKAVDKSVNAAEKWGIGGVSFDTLSSYAYSDYTDYKNSIKYNSKYGFGEAVTSALDKINDNQKFMASEANAYVALKADIIADAPTSSTDGYAFIEDVPFYAMVFKGYIPMASESINLASTPENVVLGAVEGGMGLGYTVINNWENSLIDAMYPYFYSTTYAGIKDDITAQYSDLKVYYDSIKDTTIISNDIIAPGVHCTMFKNGVKAYVNYNKSAVQTPDGEVEALGYKYIIPGGDA